MKCVTAILLCFAFAGCAPRAMTVERDVEPGRLPTSAEVVSHVQARWADDYAALFSHFTGRPNEHAELVGVTNVVCGYHVITPECTFDVSARFPGEAAQQRQMFSQFDWNSKGELEEVFVMYHTRRR